MRVLLWSDIYRTKIYQSNDLFVGSIVGGEGGRPFSLATMDEGIEKDNFYITRNLLPKKYFSILQSDYYFSFFFLFTTS
jgi:hypothetical protein